MTSSNNDHSDRDYEFKLAEAGYYHLEALEHVLGRDQQDQDDLLAFEEQEALKQQQNTTAFAETTDTDTYNVVEEILPAFHRASTRDDLDALELQKRGSGSCIERSL